MQRLDPGQVLTVLIQRMEKQIDTYVRVNHKGYDMVIYELRRYAEMMKKARAYLERTEGS